MIVGAVHGRARHLAVVVAVDGGDEGAGIAGAELQPDAAKRVPQLARREVAVVIDIGTGTTCARLNPLQVGAEVACARAS